MSARLCFEDGRVGCGQSTLRQGVVQREIYKTR